MNIGIDARTALLNKKGGFGVYTRNLIKEMASLFPEHSFDLKFHKKIEHQISGYNNINHKKLSFPLNTLWTQLRLPIHFTTKNIEQVIKIFLHIFDKIKYIND